ncbi:MAG: hypothetical protein GOMPHAMPRED_003094 [Gomphillus americanus]|uniref:Uncharacterized protein n=1 Tax=Gomphillus americanus TaxID=1940652 RepID=A0A8H3I5A2_9LECA|nr:MAG: hypothetical protein GOMPHAMPRED_003094 [Gomphillus americanus]
MYKTLHEFLTIKNPDLDRRSLKGGKTTNVNGVVGPDKTVPWSDFRLDALQQELATILSQPWLSPEQILAVLKDRWLKPVKEDSIKWKVHQKWNEPIIEQALEETRFQLLKDGKERRFLHGEVFLETNAGDGDFKITLPHKNHKTTRCKPDWYCCQSRIDEEDPATSRIMLLYGDTKPSSKFKGMWVESETVKEQVQAWRSLEQLTKYMNAKNLQYGFIITDEELVVLRLSKRPRDISEIRQSYGQSFAQQASQTSGSEYSQLIAEDRARSPATLDQADANSNASRRKQRSISKLTRKASHDDYVDDQRTIDMVIEWRSIPWDEYGIHSMTVNLVLWVLIMLALEKPVMEGNELVEPLQSQLNDAGRKRQSCEVEVTDHRQKRPRRSKRNHKSIDYSYDFASGDNSDVLVSSFQTRA